MNAKIAVATASGKIYYLLVKELKRKKIPFLSILPSDTIPFGVKAVITSKKEQSQIQFRNLILFKEGEDPLDTVSEAIRLSEDKSEYESLVIGIDPGRSIGVAVIGDSDLLEGKNCNSLTETTNTIMDTLKRIPANQVIIKIGDGAPILSKELVDKLDEALLENILIEVVREEGTSKLSIKSSNRRVDRDVNSAIRIAQRRGQRLTRKKK